MGAQPSACAPTVPRRSLRLPLPQAKPLWLCGHFTAKSMALLVQHWEQLEPGQREKERVLFWQTKSAVQPRADAVDEWAEMQKMPAAVLKWAAKGKATSSQRVASIDPEAGSAADYRHLMTSVGSKKNS